MLVSLTSWGGVMLVSLTSWGGVMLVSHLLGWSDACLSLAGVE